MKKSLGNFTPAMVGKRSLSLAAAVAAMLGGVRDSRGQTSGTFTFSGNLGAGDSDALVGLDTSKTYLDAYNFGIGAGNVTVNGVTFTGVAGTNPAVGGIFSTTGLGNQNAGVGAVPGGQLGLVTTGFVYGATTVPEVFTLSNLTVGQSYVVSFYNKVWDAAARTQNLSAGGASTASGAAYDENTSGVVGNLNILRYTFLASAPTQTVSFAAQVSNTTNHQYGFTLEQTFNNIWVSGNTWTTSVWGGGAATAPNSAGSNGYFGPQGTPTTIDLDADRTVGHLQFEGTNAWTVSSVGGKTLTLQADVGGASTLSALSGSHTIAPNITLLSPTLLKVGDGKLTLSGNIAGGTNGVTVGGGTLALTGVNDYRGETIIGSGTLEVTTVSDYGVASGIGSRALADENTTLTGVGLHFMGGTLRFVGTTPQSTNRNIRVLNGPNGGTIDASGTNPAATLSFTKTGANINLFDTGGTRTLTLTGSNKGDNGFSIPLINQAAFATSLTKSGAGTWVLNGPDVNSATGTTLVTGGLLKLAKTAVSAVSGPLSIGDGTAPAAVELGGTGGNQVADGSLVTLAGSGVNAGALRVKDTAETLGGLSSVGGAGIVENEGTATGTLTLNVAATQAFSGVLRDGDGVGSDGVLALAKTGVGTQTLSGNNTYSGLTTVSAGVLDLQSGNALGSTVAGTTVATNVALQLSGGIAVGAETLSIVGGGIVNTGAIRNLSGNNSWAGTITLTGQTRFVSDAGSLTLGGVTGAQNLILSGAGDVVLGGPITLGIGFISKDNLVGGGTGALTLSGANTYSGATMVTAGTLRLDYTTQDNSKLSDTAALVLGGVPVVLTGGSHAEVVGSTTLNAGTASSLSRSSGTAVLQLGTVTVGAGARLNVSADNIATTNNLNSDGLLLGFRVGNSFAVNGTNSPGGAIVAFTGYTNVNRMGGTIPNGAGTVARIVEGGAGGNVTLGAPSTLIDALQVDATGATTIAPTSPGDILSIGGETSGVIWHQATAGGLTIGATPNDGVLTTGATDNGGTPVLSISNDSVTKAVTINSVIANNGSEIIGVTKTDAGTAVLTANNTFGGILSASGGTLILTGNNAARPTGLSGATTVTSGGTLQLQANAGNTAAGISTVLGSEQTANQPFVLSSGGTLQLRSDSAVTFAGGNNFGGLGSATVTIDVNQLTGPSTGNTLTFAPGGLAVNTTTLNITGGNGYKLSIGAIGNGLANATLTLNPTTAGLIVAGYTPTVATTLALTGTAAGNMITGAVTNATTITKTGSSTWELAGANTSTGAITVSGGTLTLSGAKTGASGAITVANVAGTDATLNISNGAYALGAANFFVASAATTPAMGTVTQSGGSVSFTSGNGLLIGNGGIANTGTYNLTGGSVTTFASGTRGVMLGVNVNAIANFNLGGTGFLNMTAASGGGGDALLQIGRSDSTTNATTNTFTQTGGTANVGILTLGGSAGGSSTVVSALTLNGGIFAANQFTKLAAGNTNTAVINIGGTADVTLPFFPTARGTGSTVTLNFDGGTLRPLAASTSYIGGLTNAFIAAGGATFDVPTGRDITITQNLLTSTTSSGGGLTKSGVGALTLTGTETYTGPTRVTGGSLVLTGSIAASSGVAISGGANFDVNGLGGGFTLASGRTLSGGTGASTGTVAGTVNAAAGATVAPGLGAGATGRLSVSNGFSLASTAHLSLDLNGAAAGTGYDQLAVNAGNISLAGDLAGSTLTFVPAFTDVFFIILNNGIGTTAGTLNGVAEGGTVTIGAQNFKITYAADSVATNAGNFGGALGNDVALLAVPEPGVIVSLLGGMGLLLGLRRRRA